MSDQNQFLINTKSPNNDNPASFEAIIAGQPLSFYTKLTIRPVLISLAVLVLAEFADSFQYFDWIVALGLFFYISWSLINQKQDDAIHSIIAGGASGAIIGLFIALFRFVIEPKFYLFFHIITDPVTFTVAGMFITSGIFWILRNLKVSNLALKK